MVTYHLYTYSQILKNDPKSSKLHRLKTIKFDLFIKEQCFLKSEDVNGALVFCLFKIYFLSFRGDSTF